MDEEAKISLKPNKVNSVYELGFLIQDSIFLPKLNVKVYLTTESRENFYTYFIVYKDKIYKDENDYSIVHKTEDLSELVNEQVVSDHYNLCLVGLNSFIRDYEVTEKKLLSINDIRTIIEFYFPDFKQLIIKNKRDLASFRDKGLDVSFQSKVVQQCYGNKSNFLKKFNLFTIYLNSRIDKKNCLFYYRYNQIYLFEMLTHENREYSLISMKSFL